jgi:hypothetical protein
MVPTGVATCNLAVDNCVIDCLNVQVCCVVCLQAFEGVILSAFFAGYAATQVLGGARVPPIHARLSTYVTSKPHNVPA